MTLYPFLLPATPQLLRTCLETTKRKAHLVTHLRFLLTADPTGNRSQSLYQICTLTS